MKKILYIRQNKPGGTDNYCKALFSLFKDDIDLHPLEIKDIPDIPSRLFHYYYRPSELTESIKNADIIHINGYTAMGTVQAILTAKKYRKFIVYTAHWHPFECLRHPLLGKLFFYLFIRPLVRKYAHIVTTINQEDTNFFKSFHANVVQIPHWFSPLKLELQPIKKQNMILFVGRADDPVKGIEHLYQIPRGKYNIHCVGKGQIIRKDFKQHINITDEELAKLYTEASILVVPSKYEAFSYAALEALSYGTPVVMSERVRIADYLQGVKGYQIFKFGDYNDFIKKIDSSIGNVVDTTNICRIFSPEGVKEKYRSLYLQY